MDGWMESENGFTDTQISLLFDIKMSDEVLGKKVTGKKVMEKKKQFLLGNKVSRKK